MINYNTNLRKATKQWLSLIFGFAAFSILGTLTEAAPQKTEFVSNCPEKCYSDICTDEALKFIKIMDYEVDPCENFYDFVCGTFVKYTELPETDSAISVISNIQNAIGQGAYEDFDQPISSKDWETFRKVKTYYKNCLNTERSEQDGFKPLERILDSIGGWPLILANRWDERRVDIWQNIYRLRELKLPAFFPAIIAVDIDNVDSSKLAIKLHNANTNVDASWYSDTSNPDKVKNAYYNMLLNVVTILGARNDSRTQREVQEIMDFEINLYRMVTPPEELVNLPLEESRMTIRDLKRKSPGIPWLEFINRVLRPSGVSVNENEYIYVVDPKFTIELARLIQRTPKRVLANVIAWKAAQTTLAYMPKSLRTASIEYDNLMEGTSGGEDRTSACYDEVQTLFAAGMSAMYINKHFNEPIQGPVGEMVENIKRVARKNLQENEWMDPRTKQYALEKIDAMSATIGYANELKDRETIDGYYRQLEINPGSVLESAFNISYFREVKQNSKLRKSSSYEKWATSPSVTEFNAYNAVQENNIELPAGFLKYLFILDRPAYINYGLAGAFVGHEIFHGFDNQGKQYDKHGNQFNWWQPETEEKFREKSQCIIDQYSNFTVTEVNMNINGELSQGENVADNGGFRAAYLAYKEYAKYHNIVESCLPSMNYTPEQMFWISSASLWCTKQKPEYIRQSMTTDNHSPNVARVIIPLSNIKEFSEDFKCKPGSRMNPHKKCKVW